MLPLPSQLRLRLADLALVLGAWALVGEGWFALHQGPAPYLLALACWSAVLGFSRTYRGEPGQAGGGAGKVAVDHVLATAVWTVGLKLLGGRLDLVAIGCFGAIALAGLVALRTIRQRWLAPGSERLPGMLLAEALLSALGFSFLAGLVWNLSVPPR